MANNKGTVAWKNESSREGKDENEQLMQKGRSDDEALTEDTHTLEICTCWQM